jgi:hypothetical protein
MIKPEHKKWIKRFGRCTKEGGCFLCDLDNGLVEWTGEERLIAGCPASAFIARGKKFWIYYKDGHKWISPPGRVTQYQLHYALRYGGVPIDPETRQCRQIDHKDGDPLNDRLENLKMKRTLKTHEKKTRETRSARISDIKVFVIDGCVQPGVKGSDGEIIPLTHLRNRDPIAA